MCVLASGRTLAVVLSHHQCTRSQLPGTVDFYEARHDPADCSFELFQQMSSRQGAACLRVARACIRSLPSRFPFVSPTLSDRICGNLMAEKSDQHVRRFGHSPQCFWTTLEESRSSCFRRTVWSRLFSQLMFPRFSVRRKARFL